MFSTYRAGRASTADVRFEDPTVSRRQIEITVTATGRYFVVDCGGSTQTSIWRDGAWMPFSQGYVEADTLLAFGERQVPFHEILQSLPRASSARPESAATEPVSVKPRRKVSTGEIELS